MDLDDLLLLAEGMLPNMSPSGPPAKGEESQEVNALRLAQYLLSKVRALISLLKV
jgi:hypothetical protein